MEVAVWLSLVLACVVVGLAYGRFTPAGCCGCSQECGTLADDNFNRASVGGDWSTVSGSWSIVSNKLRTTSSNAIILYGTAAPGEDVIVTVKATGSADDDRLRIILAYTDADNYLFAELRFEAFGGRLRLVSRAGGVETQESFAVLSFPFATGVETTFSACYSGTVLRANVSGVYVMDTQVSGFTGTQYGLGTGAVTGNADFDDFTATRTYATTTDCPRCGCVCTSCGGNIQEQPCELEVVVSGLANDACGSCTSLNGTYVLRRTSSFPGCEWTVLIGGTCGFTNMQVTWNGAGIVCALRDAEVTYRVIWSGTPSTTTCAAWSNESLAYTSRLGTQCDGSSSTATVSSESL